MLGSCMARMLNREAEKGSPDAIFDVLGDLRGFIVGDIGSGGGFFALRFAKAVGTDGRVYAIDNNKGSLEYIRKLAERNGYGNVETVFSPDDRVPLEEGSIDLFFSRNSFHHLPEPGRYFDRLRVLLKARGRVVIIDHAKTSGLSFLNLFGHNSSEESIRAVMEKAGYSHVGRHEVLKDQSFNLFERIS